LGKNLRSIAGEKAVIVKKGSTFFCAKQKATVRESFKHASKRAKSYYPFSESVDFRNIKIHPNFSQFNLIDKLRNITIENIKLNLPGKFQIDNAGLAYLVSRWYLEKTGYLFSEEVFRKALSNIKWPGRLQRVASDPAIYLDVSHNYSGFSESVKFISKVSDISNRFLLIGLLNDKEYKQIVRLLAKNFKNVILTEPVHERAIPVSVLSDEFMKHGIRTSSEKSIIQAYKKILNNLEKNDQLFVMGSHFIIGEILKLFNKKNLTQ
jgi:dihydrofolate synthase/folylpolyglutamate synthase